MPEPVSLIYSWLERQARPEAVDWLREKCTALKDGASDMVFFTSYSAVLRYFRKDDLELSQDEKRKAWEIRRGWIPAHWSIGQAARSVVLLSSPAENDDALGKRIETLASAADVGESVALFQALPLLPYPEQFVSLASEGLRSNMTSVFNAVAVHNPYPSEQFDRDAWNQLVLKAVFVGTPLFLIQGLDERANPELARMLVDYAHERWAANRDVTPELWRPVGRYAESDYLLEALKRALASKNQQEREYAALALNDSPAEQSDAILDEYPELAQRIADGSIKWPSYDELKEESPSVSA